MNRKQLVILLTVTGLVIAAAFGAVAYGSASAARRVTAQVNQVNQVNLGPDDFTRGGLGGNPGGYSDEDLANALGISVDDLTAAYKAAQSAALKQAVEKGLITQAQADDLTKNGTAFPFGNRWEPWLAESGIDYNALLADALGISIDELKAAYETANVARIDQAVTDGRMTQEQADMMKARLALSNNETFQSSMKAAYEAAIQAAVEDGVITQAQADLILQNGNTWNTNPGLPGGMMGPGGFRGEKGGHGGQLGPGEGQPPSQTP